MVRKSSAKQPTMQLNVLGPSNTAPPAAAQQAPQQPPQAPQPPQPPSQHQQPDPRQQGRSGKTIPIIALVAVVLAAGGGLTWALWPKSKAAPHIASPMHVVPGTVQAAVLTPDEVSKAVGTTVVAGPVVNQPPAALTADPASCAVAVGPATVSGYTQGWTVFLSTTYEDSTGSGDYTVTQTVGVYGAADQASGVFGKLGDGVKACPSAARKSSGQGSVKWDYTVGTAGADTLTWTAAQDSGGGWACYRQARLKGKDVVQVAVCEGGDGKAAVQQIADQFTARVSG
ncbi:putative membrane protein [Catenulispora sp. GP43]|uniref:sensor domain-containing protein n=1 Tax=Catenulispora sp. GP43 TaxID=3156263 RepID=UPI003518F3C6